MRALTKIYFLICSFLVVGAFTSAHAQDSTDVINLLTLDWNSVDDFSHIDVIGVNNNRSVIRIDPVIDVLYRDASQVMSGLPDSNGIIKVSLTFVGPPRGEFQGGYSKEGFHPFPVEMASGEKKELKFIVNYQWVDYAKHSDQAFVLITLGKDTVKRFSFKKASGAWELQK